MFRFTIELNINFLDLVVANIIKLMWLRLLFTMADTIGYSNVSILISQLSRLII